MGKTPHKETPGEEVRVAVQHTGRGSGTRNGERLADGDVALVPRHDVNKGWYWLMLVPLVGTLIPTIYNHADPRLIGIPFFYWYQMAWIPISVAVTVFVYRKTRGDRA
jgi:Protein of unknown function (DUF3311)